MLVVYRSSKSENFLELSGHSVEEILLSGKIEEVWPEYLLQDFRLFQDSNVINSMDAVFGDSKLYLRSLRKAFSAFSSDDAFEYARLKFGGPIEVDESSFPEIQLSSVEKRDILDPMVDIIFEEISRKVEVTDFVNSSECTIRIISDSILSGGLLLMKRLGKGLDLKLAFEHPITGLRGKGAADYMIKSRHLNIIATEVKKESIPEALVQNLAQIVASRDALAIKNVFSLPPGEKKEGLRKILAAIQDVPSFGIVTTGNEWQFVKYFHSNGGWNAVRSSPYQLSYTAVQKKASMTEEISDLLFKLCGLIHTQICAINSSDSMKELE